MCIITWIGVYFCLRFTFHTLMGILETECKNFVNICFKKVSDVLKILVWVNL